MTIAGAPAWRIRRFPAELRTPRSHPHQERWPIPSGAVHAGNAANSLALCLRPVRDTTAIRVNLDSAPDLEIVDFTFARGHFTARA